MESVHRNYARIAVANVMKTRCSVILLSAFVAAGLTGCGVPPRDTGHSGMHTAEVATWSPDLVELQCPSNDCPEGVGAVVFAQKIREGYRLQRCTATLIAHDKILTNSHCGKSIQSDFAYFFMVKNGRTHRFPLSTKIFEREEGMGIEAGMAADIALFVVKNIPEHVHPRSIARMIPEDLSQLIAFKINERGPAKFEKFILEKDICRTIPRQAIFSGGNQEKNIGLALFGCVIVKGNSGTPLFTPENFDEIQVVINTSYPFQAQSGITVFGRLDSIFDVRPTYLNENFAMGNRVHCMDFPDLRAPETLCTRATIKAQIRKSFDLTTKKIYRERLEELNQNSSAIWGLRVYDVRVLKSSIDFKPRPGLVIIPYPVCMLSDSSNGDLGRAEVQYISLAMDASGKVTGQLQKSQTMRARFFKMGSAGGYQVTMDRDLQSDFSYTAAGGIVDEPEEDDAKKYLAQSSVQVNRCKASDRAVVLGGELNLVHIL